MGSAPIAVPTLQYLAERHTLSGVVTQPDRPAGRKRVMTPTAVKEEALRRGLVVLEPRRLKGPDFLEALAGWAPEVIVVMAYGRLVPKVVLTLPGHGCINIHGSLLPRHRGPCPIERGILVGDATTGITTFFMDEGFDTGDIILEQAVPIGEDDTGGGLRDKLSRVAVDVIDRTLTLLERGEAPRIPQDPEAGCHAPVIERSEAQVRWDCPALETGRLVRACDPEPGAFSYFRGQPIKLRLPRPLVAPAEGCAPGTILGEGRQEGMQRPGLVVACGEGALFLGEVQPAGKRWMNGSEFLAGYRPRPGECLGLSEKEAP